MRRCTAALCALLTFSCTAPPRPTPALHTAAPPLFAFDAIGYTNFPITTHSPAAQRYFEQGVSLLHDFWYYEALRSFRHAAALDSTCAMAWWGIYQTPRGGRELKRQALRNARRFADQSTERERRYIAATVALDSLGRQAYIDTMQGLIAHYPNDVEAKVFFARFLQRGYNPDAPRKNEPDPVEILTPLLKSHPNHVGVHHYYIHLIEPGSHPERALDSAHKIAALAPASGHIVHMPGHIYYLLGNYEKARRSFEASLRADSTYMATYSVSAANHWNYVHNLSYMVATSAEDGRYRDGLRWADWLKNVPLDHRRTMTFYQGRLAQTRLQMRYGFWHQAEQSLEALVQNDTLKNTFAHSYALGLQFYVRGMAAVESSDSTAAATNLKKIKDLSWSFLFGGGQRDDPYYARRRVLYLDVLAFDLDAQLLGLRGERSGARKRLQSLRNAAAKLPYEEPPEIARPIAESEGQVYLRLSAWQDARDVYLAALAHRPQNGHILWGLARAYAIGGQERDLSTIYEQLLRAWPQADPDLIQLKIARSYRESK
jgi:tetratricopeptide (TPR) repeat protein